LLKEKKNHLDGGEKKCCLDRRLIFFATKLKEQKEKTKRKRERNINLLPSTDQVLIESIMRRFEESDGKVRWTLRITLEKASNLAKKSTQ